MLGKLRREQLFAVQHQPEHQRPQFLYVTFELVVQSVFQ